MSRTVKAPEVRRTEILDAAEMLFRARGYATTTVDQIVREARVAKGTFYYYFRTKEDVLGALATRLVATMAAHLGRIVQRADLDAIAKAQAMLAEMRRLAEHSAGVVDDLHRPENRELHERNNVETVRVLGPLFAEVVDLGNRQGIFSVTDPLSTVQLLMAGSLFLFGTGIFNWTTQEHAAREKAMGIVIARALGMDAHADGQL